MFSVHKLVRSCNLYTSLADMQPQFKPYFFLHRKPTLPPPFQGPTRSYSRSPSREPAQPIPIIMYEKLAECVQAKTCTVVDVRSNKEVQAGAIPTSIHVPLKDIKTTFALPPESFQTQFQIPKPSVKDMIVCYCHAGKRSIKACNMLVGMGFRNVMNYSSGWKNWKENIIVKNKN